MDARRSQASTNGRRRRLINNHDDDLLAEFQTLSPNHTPAPRSETTVSDRERQLLNRVISGHLWKHSLILLTLVMLAVTIIWTEIVQPQVLQQLAGTNQPRLSTGLAGSFLVLAGQLALLIGWIRSRSTVDFSGRYRCWKWLAGCLIAIGGLWITNFQDSLPQLAQLAAEPIIGSIGAARRTLVVVPIASLTIWVLSRVVPDMSRNRWSQTIFCIGIIVAIGRLLLSYGTQPTSVAQSVLDAILLSATGLLVCSLLLHARFVLYISKDPPELTVAKQKKQKIAQAPKQHENHTVDAFTQKKTPSAKPNIAESPDVIVDDWTETHSKSNGPQKPERKPRQNKRRKRKAA